MKFSCTYDDAKNAKKQLDALHLQKKEAWITTTPDGKTILYWIWVANS